MSKYPNLKINGRLFPTWVLSNFKKYQLPEIVRNEDEDPCHVKTKLGLRLYQRFISSFLDFKSPYKDMLIYHGLGSGKTATAINVYNMLYNYTPGWNVFVLLPSSLRGTWIEELKKWLQKDEKDERFNNIHFIHYNSPYADRDFLNAIKQSDGSKKSMYIFDEAHNFIQNVYHNINSRTGKRAHVIFDYIVQDKKENISSRVLLLSGTPAVNNPFELALIYNILRPGIFPMNENKFNEIYMSMGKYKILNPEKKNMFQRRIIGLTSYYIGSTPDLFATKRMLFKDIIMEPYHQETYEHFEYIEDKLEKARAARRSTQGSVYRTYTRQSSNFVFPNISTKVNGEMRPRPNQFRISEREASKIQEGREQMKKSGDEKIMLVSQYLAEIERFLRELNEYWDQLSKDDNKSGITLEKDVEIFKKDYKMKFREFMDGHKNKSSLLKSMYASSCKMTAICFNIFRSKGPAIVYSNYVKMEGLEVFKIYLKYFGYSGLMEKGGADFLKYTEYHGGIKNREDREKNRVAFNEKDNIFGKKIKIIMISPAGSEGISLMNVRQVHILEPYWHEVRIEQLIGRAVRACSHKDLPMNERTVDIFRYKAVRKNKKMSTDEKMEEIAFDKKKLIASFLDTIKEVAVDCELFKHHNMMDQKYKCFKFNQDILFNKYIGPAYKEDIYYDTKIDNGLNSTKSVVRKIKVVKVKAVKRLQDDSYSDPVYYWYDENAGVIYDYELDFPIGKVQKDKNNIPERLDKDTYIISKEIPVPMLARV
jgi:superfamily II DNA or RNA helicase